MVVVSSRPPRSLRRVPALRTVQSGFPVPLLAQSNLLATNFGSGTSHIPKWPVYSLANRETLLFNDQCRVINDPQHTARVAMEKVLKLN